MNWSVAPADMRAAQATTEFLASAVRTATPLALAALGEVTVERAGVINIGLEGAIIAGALGAVVGAHGGGIGAGLVTAAVAGMVVSVVEAALILLIVAADRWNSRALRGGETRA